MYYVTRRYDTTKEKMFCDYSSIVGIWENNGEIQSFDFGSGWGTDFTFDSYEEWLESVRDKLPLNYQIGVDADLFDDYAPVTK